MDSNNKNQDKAGKIYWNSTERNQEIDMRPFSPNRGGIRGFGKTVWHKAFRTALAEFAGGDKKLLELGCGGSAFLPYFSREFGLQVDGMDYSERGCELARLMCQVNGVNTQIVCSDFFHAPPEMLGAYDVVASFGVVEHFTDTEKTLAQFAKFLRPGGLMITTVPNLDGLVGLAQRALASDIFGKHVVIHLREARRHNERLFPPGSRKRRFGDSAMWLPVIHQLWGSQPGRRSAVTKKSRSLGAKGSHGFGLGY